MFTSEAHVRVCAVAPPRPFPLCCVACVGCRRDIEQIEERVRERDAVIARLNKDKEHTQHKLNATLSAVVSERLRAAPSIAQFSSDWIRFLFASHICMYAYLTCYLFLYCNAPA